MIDKTKIFPLLLIILDLGAAVMFVPRKDWGNIIYWLAAAILNIAVTFLSSTVEEVEECNKIT